MEYESGPMLIYLLCAYKQKQNQVCVRDTHNNKLRIEEFSISIRSIDCISDFTNTQTVIEWKTPRLIQEIDYEICSLRLVMKMKSFP